MFQTIDPAILVFGCVQLITLVGTVWAVKADTKVLGVRVDGMQEEMKKLGSVLIQIVEQAGRTNLIEERQLAQGKRLDETITRLNLYIDNLVLNRKE